MTPKKIFYVKFEKDCFGYTAILLKGEKLIKALTVKEFVKLAEKNELEVSRQDLISIVEELTQ